jgi:hypothetical protein
MEGGEQHDVQILHYKLLKFKVFFQPPGQNKPGLYNMAKNLYVK